MQSFKAIRIRPGTKATIDIHGTGKDKVINYADYQKLTNDFFSYKGDPSKRHLIGIPPKANRLIVIDIDAGGAAHKFDGRPWWEAFCKENPMPPTYVVKTPNNGYHFYFRIPASMEPEDLSPPKELARGVDVIYNGYVLAPPSDGYEIINGSIFDIAPIPPTIFMSLENAKTDSIYLENVPKESKSLGKIHQLFTPEQIEELRYGLNLFQSTSGVSYNTWVNGLFSLRAGCGEDKELLRELVTLFTNNQSYEVGDEERAMTIALDADPNGNIGPGTIFTILKQARIELSPRAISSKVDRQQILIRAGVKFSSGADGAFKVHATESNIGSILNVLFDPQQLYFDTRNRLYILNGFPISDEELVNITLPMLQSEQSLGLNNLKKSTIYSGIELLLFNRKRDPYKEMLTNTVWDGVPRIDTFFSKYFGTLDDAYHRMVARCFWVSLAARGVKPGSKVDFMLVLEGDEGINKSSIVKAIGGDYTLAPTRPDLMTNENELRKMHQASIVELPELIGLIGQDAEMVKGFITTTEDSIRPLFGKKAFPNPRGFVFVGTTNKRRYLDYDMGERRFLPVAVHKNIDIVKIKLDREQLFAEAVDRYKKGEKWWDIDKTLLSAVINKKKLIDPLASEIKIICEGRAMVSVTFIFKQLVSMDLINKSLSPAVNLRITNCLTTIGFKEVDTIEGVMWQNPNPHKNLINSFEMSYSVSDLI